VVYGIWRLLCVYSMMYCEWLVSSVWRMYCASFPKKKRLILYIYLLYSVSRYSMDFEEMGQLGRGAFGVVVRVFCFFIRTWCIGVLVYWCIGVLVYWCIGVLVYWCIGVLVYWCMHTYIGYFMGGWCMVGVWCMAYMVYGE